MKVGRRIWLVIAMAIASAGCRAAGTGSLWLHPRPALAPESLELEEFIAEHNRNAERIQSLEARPSIAIAMPKRLEVHVDGRLAIERPRNFKLELAHHGSTKADIGSNAEEFWFWVQNPEDRSIYWCNYSEIESSALAITYQPDWIIEALGLKPISAEEARLIEVRDGPEPGTTALVFPPTRNQGEAYSRMMIVSNRDRRIKEYRVYTVDPKVLVARALPSRYKEFTTGSGDPDRRETCVLPERVKLDWIRDQLALDVALLEVKLNEFDPARGADIFVEPKIPGYERRNLAELSRTAQPDRRTTVRHTLPPPEARRGVKLDRPEPRSDAGASRVSEPGTAAGGMRNPWTTHPPDELVGAPFPAPPVSRSTPAATADLSLSATSSLER
jgi:hypothetical protein